MTPRRLLNIVYVLLVERCDEDGLQRLDAALGEPLLSPTQRRRGAQRSRRLAIAAMGGELIGAGP